MPGKPPKQNEILSAALAYAERGWRVFPCFEATPDGCACGSDTDHSRGKHPRIAGGCLSASTDPKQIKEWWAKWPKAALAIATGGESGLVVLDVDPDKGGNYSFDELFPDGTPPGPVVDTGGGGKHYYFAHPGGRVGLSVGKLGPGLDIRGDGGYVMAPPSPHMSGTDYSWEDSEGAQLPPPAPPTCVLIDHVVEGQIPNPSASPIVLQGARNGTLTSEVGRWLSAGEKSFPRLLASARNWNERWADPPMSDDEVRQTVASMCRTDRRNNPLDWADAPSPAADAGDIGIDHDCPPWPKNLVPPEDSFLHHWCEWVAKASPKRQPVLALASGFAVAGAIFARRIQTQSGLRTNLYHLAVGFSTSGKDSALQQARKVLSESGHSGLLGGQEVSSGAALLKAMAREPSTLFLLDEFGQVLSQITGRTASSYQKSIVTTLMTLHSRAVDVYLGTEYSASNKDQKERVDIIQPCATVYATSVPDNVFSALRAGDIFNGFLGRFLLWESDDPDPELTPPDPLTPIPAPLIEAVKRARSLPECPNAGPGMEGLERPKPRPIYRDPKAEKPFQELATLVREKKAEARAARSGADALWGRAWEHADKLSILIAASRAIMKDGDFNPKVQPADAQLACDLVRHLLGRAETLANLHVAASDSDAALKSLLRCVLNAGPQGITRADLGEQCPALNRKQIEEGMTELMERHRIAMSTRPAVGRGRPANIWIAREYAQGLIP